MIDRLRIGALWVKIVHDDDLEGAFAQWSASRNQIEMGPLAGDQPTTLYTTTLLHEALHAISDLYEADLTERQVRVIEQSITSLFLDNREWALMYFGSILSFQNEVFKKDIDDIQVSTG